MTRELNWGSDDIAAKPVWVIRTFTRKYRHLNLIERETSFIKNMAPNYECLKLGRKIFVFHYVYVFNSNDILEIFKLWTPIHYLFTLPNADTHFELIKELLLPFKRSFSFNKIQSSIFARECSCNSHWCYWASLN